MRRALVTGADGFIGSHLVEELVKEGVEVRALCQYNSMSSIGWLSNSPVRNDVQTVLGDIRDPDQCQSLVSDVDTVFHLAALIGIPYSYMAPQSYVNTNVQGTVNLCSAAVRSDVSLFVHTSTSEVYGTAMVVPMNEEHPLQPQSPYSASKIASDAMVESFGAAFNLPVVVARPFNTYGPRQSTRAVIPAVITQILNGQSEICIGDTSPTRDLNFISDTVKAFRLIAQASVVTGEVINIGSGIETSIARVIDMIQTSMGTNLPLVQERQRLRPGNSEVFRLLCDNSKLKLLTGFVPETSLQDGIDRTVDWFSRPENREQYPEPGYAK